MKIILIIGGLFVGFVAFQTRDLDKTISALGTFAELLVAFVIYYEFEGQRLDHFLTDAQSNIKRKRIFDEYCALEVECESNRNEAFKKLILQSPIDNNEDDSLRDICDENIRVFARIGARLPIWPSLRKTALDWHVVVLMWEMLGPYVRERRRAAGSTFAAPFLAYARASAEHLLNNQPERCEWLIVDRMPDRGNHIRISRKRMREIIEEIDDELPKKWWQELTS